METIDPGANWEYFHFSDAIIFLSLEEQVG
jgi:hypothetical protein